MSKLYSYHIHYGDNKVSCFSLKTDKQAISIAKQYPNVKKIEKFSRNFLTKEKKCDIIYM